MGYGRTLWIIILIIPNLMHAMISSDVIRVNVCLLRSRNCQSDRHVKRKIVESIATRILHGIELRCRNSVNAINGRVVTMRMTIEGLEWH
jgi:hypothetical protein